MVGLKVSPPAEDEPDECLHCAIVEMVEERIAAGGADAATLARLRTPAGEIECAAHDLALQPRKIAHQSLRLGSKPA